MTVTTTPKVSLTVARICAPRAHHQRGQYPTHPSPPHAHRGGPSHQLTPPTTRTTQTRTPGTCHHPRRPPRHQLRPRLWAPVDRGIRDLSSPRKRCHRPLRCPGSSTQTDPDAVKGMVIVATAHVRPLSGLRPRAQNSSMSWMPMTSRSSGRHRGQGTMPGSISSRPSKNAAICAELRSV